MMSLLRDFPTFGLDEMEMSIEIEIDIITKG